MKRIWIGIGLLIVLLIGGLWISNTIADTHLPSAEDLEEASQLALEGDWDRASALMNRAK